LATFGAVPAGTARELGAEPAGAAGRWIAGTSTAGALGTATCGPGGAASARWEASMSSTKPTAANTAARAATRTEW
jgi:hypothetical protein